MSLPPLCLIPFIVFPLLPFPSQSQQTCDLQGALWSGLCPHLQHHFSLPSTLATLAFCYSSSVPCFNPATGPLHMLVPLAQSPIETSLPFNSSHSPSVIYSLPIQVQFFCFVQFLELQSFPSEHSSSFVIMDSQGNYLTAVLSFPLVHKFQKV